MLDVLPVNPPPAKFRVELIHTFRTYSVGKVHPDMLVEILFDALPVLFVVTNLPAFHAHRDNAFQSRYLGDVLDN
jgi:hypothetical protein